MGVEIATLTSDLRSQYNLAPSAGAVILSVISGSPAGQAGLRQGDVIVSANGKTITTAEQVTQITKSAQPGDVLHLGVVRGRIHQNVAVTLGSPPN